MRYSIVKRLPVRRRSSQKLQKIDWAALLQRQDEDVALETEAHTEPRLELADEWAKRMNSYPES